MTTYYLGSNESPNRSDSNAGTDPNFPWAGLRKAANVMKAGDTLLCRGGTIEVGSNYWLSQRNGTSTSPIIIKNYPNETPVFIQRDGTKPPSVFDMINGNGKWFIFEGLRFEDPFAERAHAIYFSPGSADSIIRNCVFFNHRTENGVVKIWGAQRITVRNCTFDKCGNPAGDGQGDHITFSGGSHHLVEHCYFTRAGHYCVGHSQHHLGTRYTIIRNNVFEHCWTGGTGFGFESEYCLWENNLFRIWGENSGYVKGAFNHSASRCIIRRNVMCFGGTKTSGELGTSIYNDVAGDSYHKKNQVAIKFNGTIFGGIIQHCEENRFYNNTMYRIGGEAISMHTHYGKRVAENDKTTAPAVWNNWIFNNIIYFQTGNDDLTENHYLVTADTYQSELGRWNPFAAGNRLYHNAWRLADKAGEYPGAKVFFYDNDEHYLNGTTWSPRFFPDYSLTVAQMNRDYPSVFFGNIDANPAFRDEASEDFQLADTSPCVNAGTWAAKTTAAGSNTRTVPLDDVLWVTDGWGIVDGDEIRIQGAGAVRVTAVDYVNKRITVDSPVSFAAGAGVHLNYVGDRPDIGRYESGLTTPPPTPPPNPPGINTPLIAGQTTVSGTGEATATVRVYVNDVEAGSGTVASNGTWSVAVAALIADQTVYATQTTTAGTSANSTSVTVQAAPKPPAPTITTPIAAGATTVSGTGVAGATVTLYVNLVNAASTAVLSDGTWSISGLPALAGGDKLYATQTKDGSTSDPSVQVTVDGGTTEQPADPTVGFLSLIFRYQGGESTEPDQEETAGFLVFLPPFWLAQPEVFLPDEPGFVGVCPPFWLAIEEPAVYSGRGFGRGIARGVFR